MVSRVPGAVAFGFATILCGLAALLSSPSAGATSSADSVSAFIAQAKQGVTGTFYEVYQLTGPAGTGTVEVAQEKPPGRLPLVTGSGRWAFLFQTQTGISSQWIEKGTTAWDCWRFHTQTWRCSGPGTYEDSNGFALSVEPYIPGQVLGGIDQLEEALKTGAPQAKIINFSESNNVSFGPLRCMTVDGITSCLDHSGVLVSQQGGSYWSSITLLHRSRSVPKAAFKLQGRSTSSGRGFVQVPS